MVEGVVLWAQAKGFFSITWFNIIASPNIHFEQDHFALAWTNKNLKIGQTRNNLSLSNPKILQVLSLN